MYDSQNIYTNPIIKYMEKMHDAMIITVFDLILIHTPTRAQSSNFRDFRLQPLFFYPLLYKNICCGYSFELPRFVEAIQMSTHNIWFYKGNQKHIT